MSNPLENNHKQPEDGSHSRETSLTLRNSETESIKITSALPSNHLPGPYKTMMDRQSMTQFASEWLEYLKGTKEATEIFGSLEKIVMLEEKRNYICGSFDVSLFIFDYFIFDNG